MMPIVTLAQSSDVTPGDTRHKLTVKADEHFEAQEYSVAIEAYQKAYSKEKERDNKIQIVFNMGECYRYTGQFKKAGAQYLKAYKLKYGAKALLLYADMLVSQGEYEDAIIEYEAYKKLVPSDTTVNQQIAGCQKAANWKQEGSLFALDNAKELNSKKSDYHIAYAGKRGKEDLTLIISSMRDEATGRKEDGWMGQRFSDMFIIEGERAKSRGKRGKEQNANDLVKWGDLEPMSDMVNTKDHEGVVAFDSRMKTMYFTKCAKVKNAHMGCAIYSTKKVGQDWAEPELVVMAVDSSSSVGHPCLSPDDKILYFTGAMPGGKGSNDIYAVTYDRRKRMWTEPVNLNINTRGNESYPYVHGDGYLYFSSDGHVGMGGMDCFRVKLDDNGMPVGDVENMLSPINSEADDFGLIFRPGDNTLNGFVISDRKGTKGEHDIWYVTEWKKEFLVNGVVTSTKNGKPVKDATIKITGKDGYSLTVTTDDQGRFTIPRKELSEDMAYKLNLERKKFLNAMGDVSTEGLSLSDYSPIKEERTYVKTYNLKLKMDPIEVPIVLPNVLFDLAKWDLKDESKVALDTVVNILRRNPNITIELRSHTDYTDGHKPNQVLSQKRAQSCVDYLIEKGVAADRLTAVGRGETEPFTIPKDYAGYGAGTFPEGTNLTESYIRKQSKENQEVANQINRRTDFKVLSDNYVPSTPVAGEDAGNTGAADNGPSRKIGETVTLTAKDRSLGKIAAKYKMNVVQLKKLNSGLKGARPLPGMVLKVSLDGDYTEFDKTHYQVQKGDTLRSIAKKLGISVKELKQLNGFKSDKDLIIGSWITIG